MLLGLSRIGMCADSLRRLLRLRIITTARITSPRPTTPAVAPAINIMLGPEAGPDLWSPDWVCVLVDCAAVPVRVVVAKVVDGRDSCREVSEAMADGVEAGDEGLVDFGVSVGGVVEDGSREVVDGADEVEIVDDVGESAELEGAEVADVDADADVMDVGPATGAGSAAATEMSKGGLYSKVLVKSSIILKPYLSPGGKLPVPWTVFGMVHVKVPEFSTDALK